MLNSLKSLPNETTVGYKLLVLVKSLPNKASLQAINLTEIFTD